jgi:hypothetical protein
MDRIKLFVNQLYDSLEDSREAFKDFCLSIGRNYVFSGSNSLSDEELDKWLFYVQCTAIPLNMRTALLIEKNRDLWGSYPTPLSMFLAYHNAWVADHYAWLTNPSIDYSYHSKTNFPSSINDWVGFMKTMVSHLA